MIESTAINIVAIKRVFGVGMKFEDTKLANTGHISNDGCASSQVIPSYVRRQSYFSHNARLVINRKNNTQRISSQLHTFTELISTLSPKERRPANPITTSKLKNWVKEVDIAVQSSAPSQSAKSSFEFFLGNSKAR
jgi:hypothetical protein